MRHVNIPVFIPHLGCPHDCVFCNQRIISGTEEFHPGSVRDIIGEALSTVNDGDDCEIAFFGGSFTGIDRELMVYLLDIAESYVRKGKVSRLRCSTRPDYIDEEIVSILSRYSMKTVELGVQSMSEHVLSASSRGHSPVDTERACRLLTEGGFAVGGQMMVGLPEATAEDEVKCAEAICRMGCKEARVYPTIVFAGTALHAMTEAGLYTPLTVSEAAERTAKLLRIFESYGVKVLRVGLCESENLHSSRYVAGPNHPAMGELCVSRVFYENLDEKIAGAGLTGSITALVPRGAVSKAVGQKRKNATLLKEKYGLRDIRFREDPSLTGYEVRVLPTL